MPLATKNGSIIVKDGLLAENCGCCGGWYCQQPCAYPCELPAQLYADVAFSVPETSFVTSSQLSMSGCLRVTPQHFSANNGTYTLARDGQSCTYGIGTTGDSIEWPTPRIWVSIGAAGIAPGSTSCNGGVMVGFNILKMAVVADYSNTTPAGGCSAAQYTTGEYPQGIIGFGSGVYAIDFTDGHFDAPACGVVVSKPINQLVTFDIVRRASMNFGAVEIGRWSRSLTVTIRE
jgi:hypothetical protein